MHMDAAEPLSPVKIRDQYTNVKKRKGRIKCKHCGKEMSGTTRLKYHLGGVRGDVIPCPNVPTDIRHVFNREVLTKEKDRANPPSKRKLDPSSSWFKQSKPKKSAPNSDQTKSILRQDSVNCPCRQEIRLGNIGKGKSEFNYMPIYGYLHRQILKMKMKEMQSYVDDVKQSWSSSGCSILVDGWRTEEGRDLVTFLVDCPRGPVYLRSSDVSSLKDNVDALYCMVNSVVQEIGEHNVVQVVAPSTTGWMATVGEQFMKKCKTVFWSKSASHCITLMLEKIGRLEHIKVILEKAKYVIEGNGGGIVKPSKKMGSAAVPFETLEKILLEKNKFEELVDDACFWKGAAMVVKSIKPLISILDLIHGDGKLLIGYIYEAMDEAKERIRAELKSVEDSYYKSLWNVIDEIWDNHLHSPLHAAGYYLNPSLFYSSNFHVDEEVLYGLLCCTVRMFLDHQTQDLISMQLNDYQFHRGAFEEGCTPNNRSIPPLEWWAKYGGECPELQKFATRVLSQTCDGASRYGLTRQMAEKLLKSGQDSKRSGGFHDLAFVHYNVQLQYLNRGIILEGWKGIDLMDDWMAAAMHSS